MAACASLCLGVCAMVCVSFGTICYLVMNFGVEVLFTFALICVG